MKISLLTGLTAILLSFTYIVCTKSYREAVNEQLPANPKVTRANETSPPNSSFLWCTGHATATARCSDNHVSLELPKGWYNDTIRVYIGKTGGYPICDENRIDYYIVPGIFYSNQVTLTPSYCNRYDIC